MSQGLNYSNWPIGIIIPWLLAILLLNKPCLKTIKQKIPSSQSTESVVPKSVTLSRNRADPEENPL